MFRTFQREQNNELFLDPLLWPEGFFKLWSVCPSVRKFSWDWLLSFLMKLSMVLKACVLLCVRAPTFWKKKKCPPKWGKWAKNRQKIGFFEFVGKFSHWFSYKESLYYLVCSWEKSCSWDMGQNALNEWTDEMSWLFACWYKFRKAKSYFNNYWVGIVKNEWGLIDHGTLKSGVSHKWFDKLSRLMEWFLHADSDGIIFGLMVNLLYIFDI